MRTWHHLSLVALLSLALAAVAQDAAEPIDDDDDNSSSAIASATADDAAAEEEDDEDDGIDLDDPAYADLDLQTYEEDDDDFVPTEEIPADQAIPFPSDI